MTFAREAQLVDQLLANVDALSLADSGPARGASNRCVTKEFPVDPVIPDLIVVDRRDPLAAGVLRKLTRRQAHVLKRVGERSGRPVTDFYEVWRGPGALTDLVNPLLRAGLISFDPNELTLHSTQALLALVRGHRVCAVEAKLSRWKEAVDQAISYHSFANQVYVALPELLVLGRPEIAAACADARIGLLTVSQCGVTEQIRAPLCVRWTEDWIWAVAKAIGLPVAARSPARVRLPFNAIQASVPSNWTGVSEFDLPPLTPSELSRTPHAISLDA